MNIFVFKTDIESEYDIEELDELLSEQETILRWNVDREDVDKILRIESTADNGSSLAKAVSDAGYFCEELAD
ncbi:MAG: hypothetical protein ABI378_02035 [Chitinophagaceae bacterium]